MPTGINNYGMVLEIREGDSWRIVEGDKYLREDG